MINATYIELAKYGMVASIAFVIYGFEMPTSYRDPKPAMARDIKRLDIEICQTCLATWIKDERAKAKTIRMHVLEAERGSLIHQDMHRAFPPPLLP